MVGGEMKAKKLKIGEGQEELNNNIDEALVVSIEKLQEIQDELEKISDEASEKVLEVEQKYSEVRKSVYAKRNEIINSIPDFWLTAFASHPALGSLLTEEDHKIFKYLSSLEVEESKDLKSGYSITLNFETNPYFEDTKLTKTFTFLEDDTAKVTSTPIKWKEGMGMPNGVSQDEKGNKRPLDEDSFFCWFTNTEIDEMQYEVADFIKDDLWPNPLSYFNNEADEEDSDGDEADDGEDVNDSDDDDEDDDENGEDDN